jgi:phosphopantetheinyl transferase
MPILDTDQALTGIYTGIWEIREPESWFLSCRSWLPDELSELNQIKASARRLEWLAVRQLIYQMAEGLPLSPVLGKDDFGKPFFQYHPDWHLSLSHTPGYARVLISQQPCGTDIQQFTEKIERITSRFIRPEEQPRQDGEAALLHWHIVWSAKEAMYKAYGKKSLDFIQHLRVMMPIDVEKNSGTGVGSVQKDDFSARYRLRYSMHTGFVWVDAIEED